MHTCLVSGSIILTPPGGDSGSIFYLLGHSVARALCLRALCLWGTLSLGHSVARALCLWGTLSLGHSVSGHSVARALSRQGTLSLGHSV